jgi:hypothetical protein
MAADLFDDDGSKVAKSSSAEGGQNLKRFENSHRNFLHFLVTRIIAISATVEELVQEFCSRMDAFDDFGKCAEVLVPKYPKLRKRTKMYLSVADFGFWNRGWETQGK